MLQYPNATRTVTCCTVLYYAMIYCGALFLTTFHHSILCRACLAVPHLPSPSCATLTLPCYTILYTVSFNFIHFLMIFLLTLLQCTFHYATQPLSTVSCCVVLHSIVPNHAAAVHRLLPYRAVFRASCCVLVGVLGSGGGEERDRGGRKGTKDTKICEWVFVFVGHFSEDTRWQCFLPFVYYFFPLPVLWF